MGLGDRDAETLKGANWEGGAGEMERQSIGQIGVEYPASARQWESSGLNSPPSFPHLLLKPAHLQAAAERERAGETIWWKCSLDVVSSLYSVRKSQMALEVFWNLNDSCIPLFWILQWELDKIHFNYWCRDDPFYPTRIARNKLNSFRYIENINVVAPFKVRFYIFLLLWNLQWLCLRIPLGELTPASNP